MPARTEGRFPTPADRRRRNRAEVSEAILSAARAVMRAQGVGALNLQEVARRLGMRAPSLYEYFPNKSAIYDALFRRGIQMFAEFMARTFAAHPPADDPWGAIRAAMETYMTFAVDHPDLYQLVFERPVPGFTPSPASLAASTEVLEAAIRVLAAAEQAGAITPGLPLPQAVDLLNAVMHGLTALHMANEPDRPAGTGRFGALISAATTLFEQAWSPPHAAPARPPTPGDDPALQDESAEES